MKLFNLYDIQSGTGGIGKLTAFGKIYDEIVLRAGVYVIVFDYNIDNQSILNANPNFQLINNDFSLSQDKLSYFAGLGYEFNLSEFKIIPYIDMEYYSTKGGLSIFNLKEINSNNRREINVQGTDPPNQIYFSPGIDVHYQIWKHFGVLTSIFYGRKQATIDFQTSSTDYYYPQTSLKDKKSFDNSFFCVTIGIYLSI